MWELQNKTKVILLSLCSLFLNFTLFSQSNEFVFDKLTVEDGLSQGTIYTILQDSKGYLWFGTQDGLNRYDGYDFKIYRHKPYDSNSLSQNIVLCLDEDKKGNLWIGTELGGLSKLIVSENRFVHYKNEESDSTTISSNTVFFVHADKAGFIWTLSGKSWLDRLNPATGEFTRFRYSESDPASLPYDHVSHNTFKIKRLVGFYEDTLGEIWIGTPQGLSKFDKNTGGFINYSANSESPHSLSHNNIVSISEDEEKNLWICTWGGGLNYYVRKTERFLHYLHDPSKNSIMSDKVAYAFQDNDGYLWLSTDKGINKFDPVKETFKSHVNDPSDDKSLSNNIAIGIHEDEKSNVWFYVPYGGIDILNQKNGKFIRLRHNPLNPDGLSLDSYSSFYLDRSGVFWLGADGVGLNKYVGEKNFFTTFKPSKDNPNALSAGMVRDFTEDSNGDIWIALADPLSGGLNKMDRIEQTFTRFKHDPTNPGTLSLNNIIALTGGNEGYLWLGTPEGLIKYHPQKGIVKVYRQGKGEKREHDYNLVRCIYLDNEGSLWIGAQSKGLMKFNPKNEEWKGFPVDVNFPETREGLKSHLLRDIHPSKKYRDVLWLGTDGGLTKFNKKDNSFITYNRTNTGNKLSSNRIMCVYEDETGIVWLGTFGGGLNRFDPKTETFHYYLDRDGLANNVVYGIIEDQYGSLWLSTNNGLSKCIPNINNPDEIPSFTNYVSKDGLQGNEFNSGAYYKAKNGELFFGGVNGFTSFFPQDIKENPYPPVVVISDFKIFNRSINLFNDEEGSLIREKDDNGSIILDYKDDVITFEFAALHYSHPLKNKYLYKLEGFEDEWRFATAKRRFADYTNLSPGEYTFKVQASNKDNVWNKKGAELSFVITPPWWRTTYAYIAYFLLIGGFVFYVDKYQKGKFIQREREEAEIREAKLQAETAELRSQAAEAQAKILEAENDRKSHELEEARKLQLSMLPNEIPEVPGLEIEVYMRTATEVGGDYYDFYKDDNDVLTGVVGDATGHGLRAGTMVSVIKWEFLNSCDDPELLKFFDRCNSTIRKMNLWNLYMAMTLFRLEGNKLKIASAGMPPILIKRSNLQNVETYCIKGMPLGAFEKFPYKEEEITLDKGDMLLLLTDGIAEQFNKNKEVMGYERVKQIFEESNNISPKKLVHSLVESTLQWSESAPQNDDITLLALKLV